MEATTLTGVLSAIFAVFGAVTDWFITTLTSATALFYAENSLTLIGSVTIIGFAIAVTLLILAWVRSVIRGQ